MFPGDGTAKVVEKGGGAKRLKGRHDGLIVVTVAAKGRAWAEFLVKFFSLGFLLRQAIVESEDRDPLVVEVRQDDRREGPRRAAIMEVLDNEEAMLWFLCRMCRFVVGRASFFVPSFFLQEILVSL